MASNSSPVVRCQICPNDPPLPADMYCTDCPRFICDQCLKTHRKVPATENHNYVSSKTALALQKDIDNKNKDKDSVSESVSKILTQSTLEKMVAGVSIRKEAWNVRSMEDDFRDVCKRIKLVKTTEELPGDLWKLGVVNGNIWVKCKVRCEVTVYNEHLTKVKQHSWHQVEGIWTIQQVSETDVMLAAHNGLHVTDTEGQYKYKVMDGAFTDISIDSNNVAAVDYKQNKVILVVVKEGRWQSQSHIVFTESDTDYKTLQLVDNNTAIVGVKWSHKLLKVNIQSGQIMTQHGSEIRSSNIGEFHYPLVCGVDSKHSVIVSDRDNHRFQVLDTSGEWHQVKLKGIKRPQDVIVIGNHLCVLHYFKISKYEIDIGNN